MSSHYWPQGIDAGQPDSSVTRRRPFRGRFRPTNPSFPSPGAEALRHGDALAGQALDAGDELVRVVELDDLVAAADADAVDDDVGDGAALRLELEAVLQLAALRVLV